MRQKLSLTLLGSPTILLNDSPLSRSLTRKAKALLFYLAMNPGIHTREALAGLFWPDMAEGRAKNNLRTVLSELHQLREKYLSITRQTLAFNQESNYWLDAELLASNMVIDEAAGNLSDLGQTIDLYQGEFLQGFYVRNAPAFEEWVALRRADLRRQVMQGMEQFIQLSIEQDAYDAALEMNSRLLAIEPWLETAHRQRMILFKRLGRRSEAVAQYHLCHQILADELGISPSAETLALYEQILDDTVSDSSPTTRQSSSVPYSAELGQRRDFPDGAPSASEKNIVALPFHPSVAIHLPRSSMPFIGRQGELLSIDQQLGHSDRRLLTVSGPAGVGKTALVIEAARQLAGAVPNQPVAGTKNRFWPQDGLCYVDLASVQGISTPLEPTDLFLYVLADVLTEHMENGRYTNGMPQTSEALFQWIVDYLKSKQVLLILDGFDGFSDQVQWVAKLLESTKSLKILVTARQLLGVPSEIAVWLSGFSSPLQPSIHWRGEDAAALFLRYAQHIDAQWLPDAEEAEFILDICHQVDGSPLGIILTASAMHRFDLTTIATELHEVFNTDRSPWPILDWIWAGLNKRQQIILMRLSCFYSNFTYRAVQEICMATQQQLDELRERALICEIDVGRFALPRAIREYTTTKLEIMPELAQESQRRFCSYYAQWAEQRLYNSSAIPPQQIIQALRIERGNILWAWQWALQQGHDAALERLDIVIGAMFDTLRKGS